MTPKQKQASVMKPRPKPIEDYEYKDYLPPTFDVRKLSLSCKAAASSY